MTSIHKHKLPAGILPLTLSVSVLIAGICAALIFVAYAYRLLSLQQNISEKLDRNALSALNLFLTNPEDFENYEKYTFDLYEEENDSVTLQRKIWGLYEIVLSTAHSANSRSYKTAMIGYYPDRLGQSALYLPDEKRPLSLAGDTRIKGHCYLPQAGVKAAYINRKGFTGKNLVEGNIYQSRNILPNLNEIILKSLESLFNHDVSNNFYTLHKVDQLVDTTHAFHEEATWYYSSQKPIHINHEIKQNVVIQSDAYIRISSQSLIEDAIVLAPKIYIQAGFKGKLQAFATDTLIVENNCKLFYPSVLGIIGKQNPSLIQISENSLLEGILFVNNKLENASLNRAVIEKSAIIKGQAYIDALLDHQGKIYGHLACRKFILQTPAILYENHLFDAVLDNSKLSDYYVGSALWGSSNKSNIVKWLDSK